METIDYIKTSKVITANIGKLIQDLILSGKCDEFDGDGYNTYIENVEYSPGVNLAFVQVSQQEDGSFNLDVYAQSKNENLSGFASFEVLDVDTAIAVYNQVKAHSGDFKKTMIDKIKKKLEEADVKTLSEVFCTLC